MLKLENKRNCIYLRINLNNSLERVLENSVSVQVHLLVTGLTTNHMFLLQRSIIMIISQRLLEVPVSWQSPPHSCCNKKLDILSNRFHNGPEKMRKIFNELLRVGQLLRATTMSPPPW